MKATDYFIPTLRETPSEAELISHQLLLRAGFLRKLSAGVYTFLPLAWRTLQKLDAVLRTEMDAIACGEMRMPTLHPREILEETGRWNLDVVYRLKDRRDAEHALGFTHEEVMADIARRDMRSWRDLPRLLYQIQTKFRDEPRPRGGIIRTREFIMFDGYSFDRDEAGMAISYRKFYDAYVNFFRRIGLPVIPVEADGGDIGDLDNNEFMLLCESGEDTILICRANGYAANAERCPIVPIPAVHMDSEESGGNGSEKPLEMVSTPGARTIEEVAGMLATTPEHLVKTLLYQTATGQVVAVLLRGDREVNEIKLSRYLGAKVALADADVVEKTTGAPVGFAGPVGLHGVRIVADNEIAGMRNFITGANQADAHYVHVNVGRDFTESEFADIRLAQAGDPCPTAPEHKMEVARGIEVGHIFQLGEKYSKAMGADFTDESGTERPILMGSYGIGMSRTLAALIESHHDENGICWPPAVAPFACVVVVGNYKDENTMRVGVELHDALIARGVDTMLDDREERMGVKFKDADLIGYPVRVVLGKGLANGTVELKARSRSEANEVALEEAPEAVAALCAELQAEYERNASRSVNDSIAAG